MKGLDLGETARGRGPGKSGPMSNNPHQAAPAGLAAGISQLPKAISASAKLVDATLDAVLPQPGRAARPGSRRRCAMPPSRAASGFGPSWCCIPRGCSGWMMRAALRVGAAIEALHTYSLVHDDLPCMDDDDLRRGRPTTHIAFDEMTAVLAGDALLTIAFEILADARTHPDRAVCACALIARLAEAAGHDGMIGGQIIDMLADENFGVDDVINLQRLKTGQLFEFSCEAGPILGQASAEDRARLQGLCPRNGRGVPDHRRSAGCHLDRRKDRQGGGQGCRAWARHPGDPVGRGGRARRSRKARPAAIAALGPYAARAPELSRPAVLPAGPGSLKPEPEFCRLTAVPSFAASRVFRAKEILMNRYLRNLSLALALCRRAWLPVWPRPPRRRAPIPPPQQCRISMTR